ncbi:hypothetical protein [Pedobacter panaciterrae]
MHKVSCGHAHPDQSTAKEEIAKEDPFLLQNWSYYSLKDKINYKAEKAGIQVIVE